MTKPSGWTKPLIEALDAIGSDIGIEAAKAQEGAETGRHTSHMPPLEEALPKIRELSNFLHKVTSEESHRLGLNPFDASVAVANFYTHVASKALFLFGHVHDCGCTTSNLEATIARVRELMREYENDPLLCLIREMNTEGANKEEKN